MRAELLRRAVLSCLLPLVGTSGAAAGPLFTGLGDFANGGYFIAGLIGLAGWRTARA